MPRRIPPALWLAIPLAFVLYFYRLDAIGLIGPDEPRYASIGRAMARTGDWVTPRLWGAPWFEKPALLYWMTGAAFRLGLGPDLAPRLFVAVLSLCFLAFFWWIVSYPRGKVFDVDEGLVGFEQMAAQIEQIKPVEPSPALGLQPKVKIESVDINDYTISGRSGH